MPRTSVMPSTILTRLGSGLRAINRIRLDGARVALGASVLGSLSAIATTRLPDQSNTLAWLVDLATHWQWVYVIVGVVSGAMLLWRGSRVSVALAALLIGAGWLSASAPVPTSQVAMTPIFTVVSANLHVGRADLDALHRWTNSMSADVLVLQEVNGAAAEAIKQWQDYPHQLVTPEEGPFGLAVLSRHPLSDTEALESIEQPLRYRAFVAWQDDQIALSAIHPMPPISSLYHVRRAEMLEDESRWARSVEVPAIVAGDLNASPWSSAMRTVAYKGLNRATTLAPTWPSLLPVIPIDHVLTSAGWQVVKSGSGPNVGSDHRPVFAVLRLGEP